MTFSDLDSEVIKMVLSMFSLENTRVRFYLSETRLFHVLAVTVAGIPKKELKLGAAVKVL